jgi:hypothetical protein
MSVRPDHSTVESPPTLDGLPRRTRYAVRFLSVLFVSTVATTGLLPVFDAAPLPPPTGDLLYATVVVAGWTPVPDLAYRGWRWLGDDAP